MVAGCDPASGRVGQRDALVPGPARAARSAADSCGCGLQGVDLVVQVVDLERRSTRAMTAAAAATTPAPRRDRPGTGDGRRRGRPRRRRSSTRPRSSGPVARSVAGRRRPRPSGPSSRAASRSHDRRTSRPSCPAIPSHSSAGGRPPRVGQQAGHLVVLGHLDRAPHAPVEMRLDHGRGLGVHGVEGVGAEELLDLRVTQGREVVHSPAPAGSMPRSIRLMRSRPSPDRIRLLTVPSGSSSSHGHLLVGAAAEVGQLDGLAELVGQRPERVLHLFGHGHVPDLTVDVVCRGRRLAGRPLLPPAARLLGPHHVHRLAVGPGQQERPQGAPLGVELLGIAPQVEEHLLGDLLGRRVGAQDAAGEGVHGPSVPPVDLGQGRLVPATHRDHQVGVARLLDVQMDHLLDSRR